MSTVKIGKKHIQLNFGMAALSSILDEFGVGLSDLENLNNMTMAQAGAILYWGMFHHARQSNTLETFNLSKIGALDLLDSDPRPFDAMVRVIDVFNKSVAERSGSTAQPAQEPDAEKNG